MTGLSPRDVAVVRQVAGLVLQYPDDALRRDLPILRTAVGGLPAPVGGPLAELLDHLARTPPRGARRRLRGDVRPAPPVLPAT